MKKTVLITGSSRGIGAGCAEAFARAGYAIALNCKTNTTLADSLVLRLRESYGIEAISVQADVSRTEEAERLVRTVEEQLGSVDVLVNNAGVSLSALVTDTTPDEWDRVVKTNLSAVFYCTHAALPQMIRRHSGCIINISSMWGQTGGSCEVAYSAAKAGVIGFTKALAKEVGPSGIRVNAIAPGVIMTDMMRGYSDEDLRALRDDTPLMMLGEPLDVAAAAVFLASDQARYITGQVLGVNGGLVI